MKRFGPLIQTLLQNGEDNDSLLMLLDDFYQDTFHAPLVPHEKTEYKSQNMNHSHKQGLAKPHRTRRPRR
jgi:hypothetical protein